jgi:CubicO group peptidase (beta-lactamase class C family)
VSPRSLLGLCGLLAALLATNSPAAPAAESAADWPTAAPGDVGMEGEALRRAVEALRRDRDHELHSLLVVRRGRLVVEEYWRGHDRDTLHDLRSATKSITSLLTGIALDRGLLPGVAAPVLPYLAPPEARQALGPAKGAITVEHLLTMRSGLDCDDRDRKSPGHEDRMYRSRDWVQFFLDLRAVRPPGAEAHYCTGGVVALGRVLAAAGGRPVPELAQEFLWNPLGITEARWSRFDGGRQTDTGGHLSLRPRDLAKLGQLVLQQGWWQGRQVVSRAWIETSTAEQTRIDDGKPYGYLWWLVGAQVGPRKLRVVFAQGNGGQVLFVVPELELVAVFTGGAYNSPKAGLPLQVFGAAILPAVDELKPAPAEPAIP